MTNGGTGEDEKGGLPRDLTKRILTLGLGAYFLTEDTVRRYVKDAKIPRDIGRAITQNAARGKDELYGFVARELSDFLRQMDLQAELDRFVKSHKIRVSAEIEFLPAEGSPEGGEEGAEGGEEQGGVDWNVSFKAPQRKPPEPAPEEAEAPDEAEPEAE